MAKMTATPTDDEVLTAKQFADWKGGAALQPMAAERGFTYEQLRNRFIKLAGGKEQFFALREAGAGGTAAAFGAPREAGVPSVDDSKVPVLESTRGWKLKRYTRMVEVHIEKVGKLSAPDTLATVYVALDGEEYIEALGSERADFLVPSALFPDRMTRLKRFADTRLGKSVLKEYADRARRAAEDAS